MSRSQTQVVKIKFTPNEYGFYSIDIEQSNERLTLLLDNYEAKNVDLFEIKDRLNIEISKSNKTHEQDTLVSNQIFLEFPTQKLPHKDFTTLAEHNILEEIERQNSVSFLNEPLSARSYWGGNYDHSAVYLDDVKLFRSSHAFNQYSSFNSRLILHSKHHQEYIPSKFSGNLSAISEIHTKIGSFKNLGIDLGLNNMLGNVTVDFPLVRDKVSFLLSYRSSFQDPWRQGWINSNNEKLHFNETIHDLNDLYVKLNWKLKKNI